MTGVTKAVVCCYSVCVNVYMKEPLLLTEKSSPCGGGSGLPFSQSCPFIICPMPYNYKYNVLSVSLNKKNSSFLSVSNPLGLFFYTK